MTATNPASASASISERFAAVRHRIDQACLASDRDPGSVCLTAVSKTQPMQALSEALATGQRVFGENRVQEAWQHWGDLRADVPDLELRLIGPLQTNKAAEAVALFDVIETLDREKMAAALAREIDRQGRHPRLLVQVNTGAEPQKAGILPDEAEALVERMRETHGLRVEGLMAIPPVDEDPGPHFDRLASLARQLGLSVLSMGMSGDFEAAIAAGSTHVRVGSALFGERNRPHMPS
ncbi:YggS family pyridoxal phosphate-dependent enzyme [Brevundimonas vesicularis]|uniref:YggS family pyridoxal phosphate-dependent enzyme n=1 Tax=Brevundimonas vesicularis TaxID=41276 RepID=UPI0038D40F5E